MESDEYFISIFHKHLVIPWNDIRRGECCKLFKAVTDGYYCKRCDLFFHKKCVESPDNIQHPSHPAHTLPFGKPYRNEGSCDLCGFSGDIFYHCKICKFDIDLKCIDYPPPEVIDVSKMHHHKLTLLKERIEFNCDANCGRKGYGFPYKCLECQLIFHMDCVLSPSDVNLSTEVNHSYHSKHPLKLLKGQTPAYSDGKCRLCERKIKDKIFYHCFSCKFDLDLGCVLNPPQQFILDLKTHDHQLTLLSRLDSFTCNACGLKGDRSPYICVQCDFMIHQSCVGLPRVIQINRHDHRVSRTYVLGVDSVCGVCRKKVDWACGGYSCQKCPGYVVHSKCATRNDVWNGIELEDEPEEIEDLNPYVVIDDNTIQHVSHKEHHLRFNDKDLLWDDNKHCRACTHPIGLQSFYCCTDCDFILHQICAEFPTKKRHVLHNEQLALVTSVDDFFTCSTCDRISNGFMYKHDYKEMDVICASISEPFVHPSHLQHPLYYIPGHEYKICSSCNGAYFDMLTCIEDGCGFALDFKCAALPQVVKHRIEDHPLSLCYDKKASGKYWCDICEEETNPQTWFYTCKDHQATLHTKCVLGSFPGLIPRSTFEFGKKLYEVVLNKSMFRPFCRYCMSRCILPIMLNMFGTLDIYFCSFKCLHFAFVYGMKKL